MKAIVKEKLIKAINQSEKYSFTADDLMRLLQYFGDEYYVGDSSNVLELFKQGNPVEDGQIYKY